MELDHDHVLSKKFGKLFEPVMLVDLIACPQIIQQDHRMVGHRRRQGIRKSASMLAQSTINELLISYLTFLKIYDHFKT